MPSFPAVGRALLAALFLSLPALQAAAVAAVPALPGGAADPTDPAEQLSHYLRVLAAQPRDLPALIGAGRAALAIGDANAATGFYARADEVSPRDGRIKAGLASALVQMEQPREALKLFAEAVSLGVPEADIASDRGLARDLRGDSKRAQADYQLALHAHADPETTRRLALSLAISGDRADALAALDPLLQRGDKAAGRARAFVLALTGDATDAERVARTEMPVEQAAALTPFLGRLATLKASQKAAAVHLGLFPSIGRKYSEAELFADATADVSGAALPPARPQIHADAPLVPRGPTLGTSRRRPSRDLATVIGPESEASSALDSISDDEEEVSAMSVAPVANVPASTRMTSPTPDAIARARAKAAADAKALANAAEAREARRAADAEASARKKKAAADSALKADAAKSKAETKAKAEAASKAKADAKEKADAALKAKADAKAKAAAPERYWVQVASGKNKADFDKVWEGLTAKAPKLLRGRATWTAPWRASNRLLVGPFKTDEEAQGFVNTLGKAGLSGIQFTTRAGAKVERLPLK